MNTGDVVKVAVVAGALVLAGTGAKAGSGWGYYGGDEGGQRFSSARQITPANVSGLKQAWSFSTGDMTTKAVAMRRASFENTPILADGKLYVCSPFNEVSALDPGTGRQLWRFDPKLNIDLGYPNKYVCRGVAYAMMPGIHGRCSARIYMNTADRRLIALDARSGNPCPGFGKKGTVVIPPGQKLDGPHFGRIQTTSPPVVTQGVVIVGSSIDDNQKVDELRGTVHAFDAVTGTPKWSFDPLRDEPRGFSGGAANVCMGADEPR